MALWGSSLTFTDYSLGLLADASVKAAAVLAACAAVAFVARRASAAWRHLLWSLGICAALILPVLSGALPSWRMRPVAQLLPKAPAPAAAQTEAPSLASEVTPTPVTVVSAPASGRPAVLRDQGGRIPPSQRPAGRAPSASRPGRGEVAMLIMLGWGLGALLALAPVLAGAASTWWLVARSAPARGSEWEEMLGEARRELFVLRRVRLRLGPDETVPMVWGWARPVVLLPASAGRWTRERKRLVLLHELAHVRRADCLLQLLAHLVCALYWFDPLAWLAARRLCHERERACDDVVLGAGLKASEYATHLVDLARALRGPGVAAAAAVPMARGKVMDARIRDVLDPRRNRGRATRRAVAVSTLAVLALLTPLARVRAFALTGAHPVQLLPAEKGPGREALYAWEVNQSWPGGPQYDARLDRPVQFWRTAIPLAEVFAEIERQTGAHLAFWPEGDENPRVRVNLYLNPETPPTLRELMAQLAWVADCTFAYSEQAGRRSYYLLGTTMGHGGLAAGAVEDRARARGEGARLRAVERERSEVCANLEELQRALSLPLSAAAERYREQDEYLLFTLTDPALRAAAQYVCKVVDPNDLRDHKVQIVQREWSQLSEDERALVRKATNFEAEWLTKADVSVQAEFMQPANRPGAFLMIDVRAKIGPREYLSVGFSSPVAPTRDTALDELARLAPSQIAALRRSAGESVPQSQIEAYAERWKVAVMRARDRQTLRSLATEAAVSPATQERLSALAVPLESGRPYALWEVQEVVAAASGLNIVSDSFWQPVRPLQEARSALLALVSACHPWADRVQMASDAAWLAGWEWGDAGSFLRFRSIDRDVWRGALLPEAALASLDQYLSTSLPAEEKPEWPQGGFALRLSLEPSDLLHIGSRLDDLQLMYGGRLLYEDPSMPTSACRHALRETFLALALDNPVARRAGWEVSTFRLMASLTEEQWEMARNGGLRASGLRDEQLAILRKAVPLWEEGYESRLRRWVLRAGRSHRGRPAAHPEWEPGRLKVSMVEPAKARELVVAEAAADDLTLLSWQCPYQCTVSVPAPATKAPRCGSNGGESDQHPR